MNSKLMTRLFTSAGILFLSLVASAAVEVNGQAKQAIGFDPAIVADNLGQATLASSTPFTLVTRFIQQGPKLLR